MTRSLVVIQRNPRSGSGARRAALIELTHMLRHFGFRTRMFSSRDRLAAYLSSEIVRAQLKCIVAAGGDGTVGDVINRFPDVPVALLPLGTENLLARYLRIPASGRYVAELIAANARRRIDIGTLGGRRFTIMASFGFDADVVHRTHEARTGHITRSAYVGHIWSSLMQYAHPPLRFYCGTDPDPFVARLGIVVNLPVYAMGLQIAPDARADDGLFDLRLFEQGSAFQMFRYFYRVAANTHHSLPDVRTLAASRIRVESDVPAPTQVDGDPAGWTPAEVRILPSALEVFAPPVGTA